MDIFFIPAFTQKYRLPERFNMRPGLAMQILASGLMTFMEEGLSGVESARKIMPWLHIHAGRTLSKDPPYTGFPDLAAENAATDDLVAMVEREMEKTGTFSSPKPNPVILGFINRNNLPGRFNLTVDEILDDFDFIYTEHLIMAAADAQTTASEAIYYLYLTSGGKVTDSEKVPEYFEDNDHQSRVIDELANIIEGEIAKYA